MKELLDKFIDWCISFGGKLLIAILVLVIGSLLIKFVVKLLSKRKLGKHEDPTVRRFLMNFNVRIIFFKKSLRRLFLLYSLYHHNND